MHDAGRVIFYIDAYSPETIPMAKLADYMVGFATLLGKDNAVHFAGLQPGSTRIAARVDFEDLPKVTSRLDEIRRGNAPKDAARIFEQIDAKLANDNAIATIFIEGDEGVASAELLAFPGRNRPKMQSYGPFTQNGHLDGRLILVGGKDDTISVRLQNGDETYSNCDTTEDIARELAKHLFQHVRIHGNGRWMRGGDGKWTLIRFRIQRFEVLEAGSLRDVVTALRAARGSGWKEMDDPLTELDDLRRDNDEMH